MKVFFILLAMLPAISFRANAEPYRIIYAADNPQGEVTSDKTSLKGKCVKRSGDWQPIFSAMLPDKGENFKIWIRYHGSAVQLKGVNKAGAQKELAWIWAAPTEWTWASFGTFNRSQIGERVLVIRGQAPTPTYIDALVLSPEDTFNPSIELIPISDSIPIQLLIDWKNVIAHASKISYSLNAFVGFDPASTSNERYQKNMAYMNPGIVRLHNMGLLGDSKKDASGWVDTPHKRWDKEKIGKALKNAYLYHPHLLINIPGWPDWMDKDKDGYLDKDQFDAYARFCAELVRIVNKDFKKKALYWEITNEKDGVYYTDLHSDGGRGGLKDPTKPDRIEELAAIYNRCAIALKKADSSIKVGGPAFTRPDLLPGVRRFIKAASNNLDFLSYHAYASGTVADSDSFIFDRTIILGQATADIVKILKESSPSKYIPAFLDEYNISWNWETRDPRMADNRSAVFDALAIKEVVNSGAAACMAWNEKDGIYGKTDNEDKLRPAAHLFHLLNSWFVGDSVMITADLPGVVNVYAIQNTDKKGCSILLINRTERTRKVQISMEGWTGGRKLFARGEITRAGYTAPMGLIEINPKTIMEVPALSVVALVTNQ